MQYFIVTILFSFDANIMAREMNDIGQKITSIVHRRPHNGDLAVFNKGSQRDDKFSALLLMESLGGVVDHYAYKPQDGSLVQYDNKRIYGRMSWEYVLCAFDQLGVTNYGLAHNQLQGHDNHIHANIKNPLAELI